MIRMMKDDDNRTLDLLLHEIAEVRDDDRYMFAQYVAIVTAALLVIGAMATLFYQTCLAGSSSCTPGGVMGVPVSIWIYIGAPLLPVALIAYAVLISAIMVLRSYYLRTLEGKVHELTRQSNVQLPVPSWSHFQLEITGQSASGGPGRLILVLIYGIVCLMILGCLCLAFFKIPAHMWRYRVLALVTDVALVSVLVSATLVNLNKGSGVWEHALALLPKRLQRTQDRFPPRHSRRDERTLLSYLLLPRNQEELLKSLFIPICFFIGKCLVPGSLSFAEGIDNAIIFFFIFEFDIYQARYLLNDVRDRNIDCKEGLSKRRFPCSQRNDLGLKAAAISFFSRIGIAGLLVLCVLPHEDHKSLWYSAFLAAVFIIAVPYEDFRSRCIRAAKGGSPLRTLWTVAVVAVVGLGYGLRSVVGLWLAGVQDTVSLLLLAVGASLFGSTFVGLTWALESTRTTKDGLREAKGHLLAFRSAVERAARRAKLAVDPSTRVLKGWQSPLAPWSITEFLATVGLTSFAIYVVHPRNVPFALSLPWTLVHLKIHALPLLVVLVLLAAEAVAAIPVAQASIVTVFAALATGFILHAMFVPAPQSVLAALIATLPAIVTCSFRRMRFNDLPGFSDKVVRLAEGGLRDLYLWFAKARV